MTKTKDQKPLENIKECSYYVKGMHCASCELLIEKKLLKSKNIESVEASTSNRQVTIYYRGSKPIVAKLNKKFKNDGYSFYSKPPIFRKKTPLIGFKNGQILINKRKFSEYLKILGVAVLFIFVFLILNRTGWSSRIVVNSYSSPSALFVFGLVAGFSSCAALVGGIVLSMSKQWSEIYHPGDSLVQKFQPHLLFNLGRLLSFALLGALLGAIGNFVGVSLTATAFLAIIVSALMILLALQMLGVRGFQKFQIATPKIISRFVADEANFEGRTMPFVLGALTFFLPCGFTVTAQGLALLSGNSWQGFLIMFLFALGTLPMLAAIGFSTLKLTAKPHLTDKFLKVAGVLVLFFGLYTFNSQLNVLGLPSFDDLSLNSSTVGSASIVKGKQVLKMDAFAYGYEPNEFTVKVGIPVRWEIKNKGVSGCTNAVVSKGLFEGEIRLDEEIAVKEFTPQKPGRYKFSCWMGMISGVIRVVDQDGSTENLNNPIGSEVPSGASGCGSAGRGGCTGGCRGGCGNPGCPYLR